MGRLWQTLVLAQWNSMFAWIPMESILFQNRPDNYQAIETTRNANDPGVFIEFTLSALFDSIKLQEKHQDKHQDEHQVELSAPQRAVLQALEGKSLSRKEIFAAIGLWRFARVQTHDRTAHERGIGRTNLARLADQPAAEVSIDRNREGLGRWWDQMSKISILRLK